MNFLTIQVTFAVNELAAENILEQNGFAPDEMVSKITCTTGNFTNLLKRQIHFALKLSVGCPILTILNVGWLNFSCEFRPTRLLL